MHVSKESRQLQSLITTLLRQLKSCGVFVCGITFCAQVIKHVYELDYLNNSFTFIIIASSSVVRSSMQMMQRFAQEILDFTGIEERCNNWELRYFLNNKYINMIRELLLTYANERINFEEVSLSKPLQAIRLPPSRSSIHNFCQPLSNYFSSTKGMKAKRFIALHSK